MQCSGVCLSFNCFTTMSIFTKYLPRFWKLESRSGIVEIKSESSQPFVSINPSFESKEINVSFREDNEKWVHQEWIKKIEGTVWIEPQYCACIKGFRQLYVDSLVWPRIRPSIAAYTWGRLFYPTIKFPEAIVLDGHAAENYFHFFLDVINKAWLLEDIPDSNRIPIVINERMWNLPYVQGCFKFLDKIKSKNLFILKPNEFIKCEKVWLIKPMRYKLDYLLGIRSLFANLNTTSNRQRIFFSRKENSPRHLLNEREVFDLCEKHGFHLVYLEDLSFLEQISVSQNASHIIGIHGAGLTNILFSRGELSLLELMPANRIACQYYWMAETLPEIRYDVVLGSRLILNRKNNVQGFEISAQLLKIKLEKWLI